MDHELSCEKAQLELLIRMCLDDAIPLDTAIYYSPLQDKDDFKSVLNAVSDIIGDGTQSVEDTIDIQLHNLGYYF